MPPIRLNIPIVQGSLLDASLPEASFDVVLMMEYLEHKLDPRAVLMEARRFFTPHTLRRMLAECGYELVRVEPFSLPLYIGMSMVQSLGFKHWRKHKNWYPLLSSLLALPMIPFTWAAPEFMFVTARAVDKPALLK